MDSISFIVCTKNAIDTIEQCLGSIKDYPVILVDKDSFDGTLQIAKQFKNVKIIHQKGDGLADAHNIGLEKTKTEFCFIWGSDNVLRDKLLLELHILYMKSKNWIGCSFQTLIKNPKTYLDKAINIWWTKKFMGGKSLVCGTPVCYLTSVLKKYKYNSECKYCDDSELAERLSKDNLKQGYSPFFCYDISKNDLKSIIKRWKMYGISDFQYWQKYSKGWTWERKLRSLIHPFISEWIGFNLTYSPFYILIVSIRAYSYYKNLLK
jgi:glycosyltransferase involved in cell wall biosynthesis